VALVPVADDAWKGVTMLPAILRSSTSGLTSLRISLEILVFVYALNLRAASELQRQLDELKQLE
jgi:hypothetical protein